MGWGGRCSAQECRQTPKTRMPSGVIGADVSLTPTKVAGAQIATRNAHAKICIGKSQTPQARRTISALPLQARETRRSSK